MEKNELDIVRRAYAKAGVNFLARGAKRAGKKIPRSHLLQFTARAVQ
jgi:hypothetical protein